jgi:Esterase/lipase
MKELNITKIEYNPSMEGQAGILPDITYSSTTGKDLKLLIISPWRDKEKETKIPRYPLIVFVQGSAWTFPDIYYEIPQLSEYARRGYVVATVTHRNCLEGSPFPAFLQDVKTAIRFLRKNADEYGIDTERIGIWGTSSGGNTALLVGLTQDDDRYKTEEYAEFSDGVKCVVDCFGPSDLRTVVENIKNSSDQGILNIFHSLMGGDNPEEHKELLWEMSPVARVIKGKAYPPFLILHGNNDTAVSYDQSVKMHQTLLEEGVHSEMVCVDKAPHEGSFWSRGVHDIIMNFFEKNL